MDTKEMMENARIVREEAIRLGCTHAWIMYEPTLPPSPIQTSRDQ